MPSLITYAAIVATLAVAYFKAWPGIRAWWKDFNHRYRVTDDGQLIIPMGLQALRHIYQTLITHRFNQFYDIEWTALSPRYSSKIALNYINLKPGKNFKIDGDDAFYVEHYTYREMYDIVLRLSYILHTKYGIEKGDTVTMYFMNKPLFIFIWLALWNIGAIPAFLNYNLKHNPLVHSIKVVKPTCVLVDATDCEESFNESKQEILDAYPDLQVIYLKDFELLPIIKDPSSPEFRQSDKVRDAGVQAWHPALLVYTSGTTGMPKSAVNSWRKCFFAAYLFPVPMKIYETANIYTAMPLYHGTGSILGALPAFEQRGTLSLGHKFSVSSYWAQVRLTNANTIQYVGEVCRYLVEAPETEDERMYYGKVELAYGNGLRKDIWPKLKHRFGIKAIGEFYASSESPFATTCREENGTGVGAIRNNGWLADKFLGATIYTLVRMQPDDDNLIYRNKDGFCEEPHTGEKGELITKIWNPRDVKTTFPGYVNNEEATYSKVIRDVFHKGDAWVRSDDLMMRDGIGNIYFTDRMGDTFRWKSENVSTTEVENELLELDEIEYCAVVGCKVKNHEGRCGYAVLQTRSNNEESDEELKQVLDKVADRVITHLPHFGRPCFVRFDTIELTFSHKISKKRFRNPVLPAGPSGTQKVYYLDTKGKRYLPLDAESYEQIAREKIRI
ncbi:DEKNAAC103702 [Brettanomyces naardenensis]|uniref:Very long-chain fatty acid transport protein n=1 Tax=Brettanomyces naardenensis TaxID=13370 RepID=A0A448YN49_BRENA|nr:DEKNAAC103702 [Brettanomyces naardenensis]